MHVYDTSDRYWQIFINSTYSITNILKSKNMKVHNVRMKINLSKDFNPEDAVSKYYICKRYRTNNFLQKIQRIRRISNTLHASQLYTPKCIPEALFPQIRQNGSSRGSEDGTYFSRFRFRLLTPSGRSFPESVLSDFDTSILFLYSDYKELCMHASVVYNATDYTITKYSRMGKVFSQRFPSY